MTPKQRRNHLLGLFYYQNPESQQKRLSKLLEEALRRAEKQELPDQMQQRHPATEV